MPLPASRIIVTGASGFLGARTAELLVAKGHKLALLLRNPEQAWRIKSILPQVEIIAADMTAVDTYTQPFKEFRPDILLHAGWIGVSGAERNAVAQTYNIAATADLLKAAIDAGARHFVGVGSQAEYGAQNCKLDEKSPAQPTTFYGQSKLATCQLAQLMCAQADLRFAWVRLFSAYGPRDNPNWLIPSLIKKLLAGEKPTLTSCEQLWDFVHIDDAAAATARVVETATADGIFNLGGGAAPPLRQTITTLRDLINPRAELGFGDVPYRPDQVMHLEADISRLKEKTGWQPKIDLPTGLRETVAWFSQNR